MVSAENVILFSVKLHFEGLVSAIKEQKEEENFGPNMVEKRGYPLKRLNKNGK